MTLGICIIGCGRMAGRHARSVNKLGLDLYFASRDGLKARDYARRFRAKGYFGSYELAMKDDRINAVIICTPHDRHLKDVQLAAQHKKHILLEKPIATTLKDADDIIAAAKKAGVTLMVAENFYFLPAVVKAKELISSNAIGKLRFIQLNYFRRYNVSGWRSSKLQSGGGMFMDLGVHLASVVRNLGGRVKSIYAVKPLKTLNTEGDDAMFVLATLENGVIAEINASWATHALPRVQLSVISGTEGTIFLESSGLFVLLWGKKKRLYFTGRKHPGGLLPLLQEFTAAIREGREPSLPAEEAKKDLAFVLAAYESAKAKESTL